MKASSICKDFALESCSSAPTLKRDQTYSVFFIIRAAWGPTVQKFLSFFPSHRCLSMLWLTKNSQHSNLDITVENVRVSSDCSSISKEKYDLEVQSPVEEISDQITDDGHPDGGLTAWLIVAGVRVLFLKCDFHNLTIQSLSSLFLGYV